MTFLLPQKSLDILLQDAMRRDLSTARRMEMLALLLNERYLTREQIMTRVEGRLGAGCFGCAAWEDTFYRDLRVVKEALRAAGYVLKYSRSRAERNRAGYYLEGEPPVSAALTDQLQRSIAETDPRQIDIFRRLTPAERVRMGCSVTDAATGAAAYRIRHNRPELTPVQSSYLAIQGKLPE